MKQREEPLTERLVTYSIELDGKFYIDENVPARVNEKTGEQYFAPETVEKLQQKIRTNTSLQKLCKKSVPPEGNESFS